MTNTDLLLETSWKYILDDFINYFTELTFYIYKHQDSGPPPIVRHPALSNAIGAPHRAMSPARTIGWASSTLPSMLSFSTEQTPPPPPTVRNSWPLVPWGPPTQ